MPLLFPNHSNWNTTYGWLEWDKNIDPNSLQTQRNLKIKENKKQNTYWKKDGIILKKLKINLYIKNQ